MINKPNKNQERRQRAKRTSDIHGTAKKPRLSVFRSLSHIYAQLIDDDKGETIVAVNSLQVSVKGNKKEQAFAIGKELAKKATAKKIKEVVFDRNGYVYTGRIEQVAAGAREGGLQF